MNMSILREHVENMSTCVSVAYTRVNICGQQCRHTCCPQMLTRVQLPLGPQGQKDSLSLMSLNRQIEEGLKNGYEEKEVVDGIIRCIPSHLPLKDYIEAMRESGLETINKILRAHFQEKKVSELYTNLTGLVQSTSEEPQNFLLRAMNLREKVIFASKVGNAKVRYEPVQCQSMFLHAVETGLISNILRTRMRPHLQNPEVSDAELINELNIAVTEESERNLKLGLGMRGKAKVAQPSDIKNDHCPLSSQPRILRMMRRKMRRHFPLRSLLQRLER